MKSGILANENGFGMVPVLIALTVAWLLGLWFGFKLGGGSLFFWAKIMGAFTVFGILVGSLVMPNLKYVIRWAKEIRRELRRGQGNSR